MAAGLLGVRGGHVAELVVEDHRADQEHAPTLHLVMEGPAAQGGALKPGCAMQMGAQVWRYKKHRDL